MICFLRLRDPMPMAKPSWGPSVSAMGQSMVSPLSPSSSSLEVSWLRPLYLSPFSKPQRTSQPTIMSVHLFFERKYLGRKKSINFLGHKVLLTTVWVCLGVCIMKGRGRDRSKTEKNCSNSFCSFYNDKIQINVPINYPFKQPYVCHLFCHIKILLLCSVLCLTVFN